MKNKASRVNIRCNEHSRALLKKAAAYSHTNLSEFVLSHVLTSAEKIVQANENITLQQEDFQFFLNLLDKPVEPNSALQKAFRLHSKYVLK